MKNFTLILSLLLILQLFTGCSGSQTQNYTISGSVYFGGEPNAALPDPAVASLKNNSPGNYYNLFTLKSTGVPPKPAASLIVSCDPKMSPEEQQKVLKELGFKVKRQLLSDHNSYVVTTDSLSIDEAYAVAKKSPFIKTVEYNNNITRQSVTPNDPGYNLQWDLRLAKFNVAWDQFKGRDPVTVAVLDTGLNTASIEFTGRLAPPGDWYDFVDKDNDPSDNVYYNDDNKYSHGTNVAGIIGAIPDNSHGYAGCAWSTAIKILPVRVLDSSGLGAIDTLVDGIYWAVLRNAKVINLSLGTSYNTDSALLNNAVDFANSRNVTIVCAAGNENTAVDYPARLSAIYPNVIAVGATGYYNRKAYYSCYGPELSVMAPGGDKEITGTIEQKWIWNITYDKSILQPNTSDELNCGMIGTSQATPHVTALAALLYSYGVASPAQIRNIITQTATDLGPQGRDNEYGSGLINAFAALTAVGNDITKVTIGIRNPRTKQDLPASPVNPDNSGSFVLANVPKGNWELYAEYNGLTNGYKYYCSVSLNITHSLTRNLSLQLLPDN